MVKIFTLNKNGKIEFTKEELEALLKEVWQDGYSQNRQYWWASQTWSTGSNPIAEKIVYTTSTNSMEVNHD